MKIYREFDLDVSYDTDIDDDGKVHITITKVMLGHIDITGAMTPEDLAGMAEDVFDQLHAEAMENSPRTFWKAPV